MFAVVSSIFRQAHDALSWRPVAWEVDVDLGWTLGLCLVNTLVSDGSAACDIRDALGLV